MQFSIFSGCGSHMSSSFIWIHAPGPGPGSKNVTSCSLVTTADTYEMMSPAKVLQWLTHVLRPGSCIHSPHLVPCSHVQPLRPLLPPPSLQPQGLSTCCASCHRCPLLSPQHASSSSSSFRSQLFPASLHHVPCNTSDLGTSS